MVDNLLKHRTQRETVMAAKRRGEAEDGYTVCQRWGFSVPLWTLDSRIETRQNATISLAMSTVASNMEVVMLTRGQQHDELRL